MVFEPLFADVVIPANASSGAAGYDVCAYIRGREIQMAKGSQVELCRVEGELVIPPQARAVIPLGFRAHLPPNIEGQIRLRSSVGFKKGLVMPNAPATIDPDYPGEWVVIVWNSLGTEVSVRHGERIAQIVFAEFRRVVWDFGSVAQTTGRTGGLGSTGP